MFVPRAFCALRNDVEATNSAENPLLTPRINLQIAAIQLRSTFLTGRDSLLPRNCSSSKSRRLNILLILWTAGLAQL